jgi:hypothetical protein
MRKKSEGCDDVSVAMMLCGAAESHAFQSKITDPVLQTKLRVELTC